MLAEARTKPQLRWSYKGRRYVSEVECACPACGADAVIALPAVILAEQPDATTLVCHPSLGGCNQGWSR